MKPYGKSKKPGRIGGDPLDNVVGSAAGVQGQKVQPGKGPINEGKSATVKVGQSSSFNVSSGLVNALDVVQGVSSVLQGADKLKKTIDQSRMDEMKKKLAERTAQDDWTNPEAEGYLSDEEKVKAIRSIQDEYKGGWLGDNYRAEYAKAVTATNIREQNLGFNADLAWAQRSRSEQIAMGVPVGEAQENTDKLYEEILRKHGKDSAKAEQIRSAQLGDAALWAQAVTESSQTTVANWSAAGGLERLHRELPSDIGYEQWEELAIASMAQYGGDEASNAMWQSYNEDTGKFEGPYADMLKQTVRRSLEPVYNQSVAMQMADDEADQKRAIFEAPKTSTVDLLNATTPEVGRTQVGNGLARMYSIINSGQRPMSDSQRRPILGSFLGQVSSQAFQMDATFTTQDATDMMHAVAFEQYDTIAASVGMEPDSEEFDQYIQDQIKVGMSTFRAAQAGQATEQRKDADFQLSLPAPSTDPETIGKAYDKDPFIGLMDDANATPRLHLINANTGKGFGAGDSEATAMGQMGIRFITQANWQKSPEERAEAIQGWVDAYTEYINADDADRNPGLLLGRLKKASEHTPFSVGLSQDGGSFVFNQNPEYQGETSALNFAKIGAVLPYLALDPDTGKLQASGNVDVIQKAFKGMMTAEANVNDSVNPAFTTQAQNTYVAMGSIFDPTSAQTQTAELVMNSLTGLIGQESVDQQRQVRAALVDAMKGNDWNEFNNLVDGIIANRQGVAIVRDNETQMITSIDPDAMGVLGAASLVDPAGNIQMAGKMGWANPFDLYPGGIRGIDDDVAASRSVGFDQTTIQRLHTAARNMHQFRWDPQENVLKLADPDNVDRQQLALDLNKQLGAEGYQWNFEYGDDGEVVRTTLDHSPVEFTGRDMRIGPAGMSFSGDFDQAMGEAFKGDIDVVEEEVASEFWTDLIPGGPLAREIADWWGQDKGTTSRLHSMLVGQITSAGDSEANAEKLLRDPNQRRLIADNATPARRFWTGTATPQERNAFANQIDETIIAFSKAGVEMDSEDLAATLDLATGFRNGKPDPALFHKAKEIAEAQGYTLHDTNPPMWSLKLAVLESLFPEEQSAIRHISMFDLQAERGFTFASDQVELTETQKGWDSGLTFKLDNLRFINADVRNLRIPIFSSMQISDKAKSDVSVLQNRRLRQGKEQKPFVPGAAGMGGGYGSGPGYRRFGGSGPRAATAQPHS
jgi:hypothetical protein